MNRGQWRIRFVLLLCLLMNTGCAPAIIAGGAAVGVGSTAFVYGQTKSEEKVSFDVAWNATRKAVEELGYTTTSKENGEFWGELIARDLKGKKLTVKLRSPDETRTEIKIRVGLFGDEQSSRRILDEIRSRY
ncbi:MAG: DUF3568 family protein [Pseudomonadota bacterium]